MKGRRNTLLCDECGKEIATRTVDQLDYTELCGLDPRYRRVMLDGGFEVLECACGMSPVIPEMDGLHHTIALALIENPAPLDGTSVRFLRRTLGLTQEEFAEKIELSPQYLSRWENGHLPDKARRVLAAVVFLHELIETEEAIDRQEVARVLSSMAEKAVELRKPQETRVEFDENAAPPVWMIADLSRGENDGHIGGGR